MSIWSVILAFCLSSGGQLSAHLSLCRDLEYLLNVRYTIVVKPQVAGFLISNTVFVTEWKHYPMFKNIQKWASFAFDSVYLYQTFTECVSSQYTFEYRYGRYCKLWNAFCFYSLFGFFIHYYWPFMSELLFLYQTLTDCVSNQYT